MFITRADLRQAAGDLPELAPLFLDPDDDLTLRRRLPADGLRSVRARYCRWNDATKGRQLE